MVDRRKATRLDAFIRSEAISPSALARLSGYSRQHIHLVRTGKKEPSREFIRATLHAVCRIKAKRYRADELFELEGQPRRSNSVGSRDSRRRKAS